MDAGSMTMHGPALIDRFHLQSFVPLNALNREHLQYLLRDHVVENAVAGTRRRRGTVGHLGHVHRTAVRGHHRDQVDRRAPAAIHLGHTVGSSDEAQIDTAGRTAAAVVDPLVLASRKETDQQQEKSCAVQVVFL